MGTAGRVRTRGKAITEIISRAVDLAPRLDALSVIHGAATDLDRLMTGLDAALVGFDFSRTVAVRLGPVVGTHVGSGAIGIAYRLR